MSETIHTLYSDAFIGVDGTRWSVDIERVGGDAPGTESLTSLTFPADTPAEIEWPVAAKLDAICASALTLRLESETDRRFTGLYSTRPGEVRVAVRRDGELYWCGLLDTELYEEPYSYSNGYDVTFTFSDLGQLKRMRWDMRAGHIALRAAVERCLAPLLREGTVPVFYSVATEAIGSDADGAETRRGVMDGTMVDCSNFYDDDDDEGMTLYEVLEALLQPLGLRVEQRNGAFHVYDLHSLYEAQGSREVRWDGTDATLGVDKVYNNVRVTFAPNVHREIIDCTISHDDVEFDGEPQIIERKLYPDDTSAGSDPVVILPGFTFAYGKPATLPADIAEVRAPAEMFRLTAAYSGSDCAGIKFGPDGNGNFDGNSVPMLRTRRIYIPDMHIVPNRGRPPRDENGTAYFFPCKLHITLGLLLDALENPFERNSDDDKKIIKAIDESLHFAYVPMSMCLYDSAEGGLCLYHYDNAAHVRGQGYKGVSLCRWVAGPDNAGTGYDNGISMYLSYYNDDRKSKSPLGGWCTNRPSVGGYYDDLPSTWSKRGDGEFVPMPPCAGWLEVVLYPGVYTRLYPDHRVDKLSGGDPTQIRFINGAKDYRMKWLLYKDLKIELRGPAGQTLDEDVTGDAEYSAWLLREAEEELPIDTAIGSDDGNMACARGVLIHSASRKTVARYARAGVTDRMERLLIGTAFSQHASRHTTLSGTTTIEPEICTFTDAAMPGMVLMRTGAIERLREAESTTTLYELSPESYEGIEYEQ